MNIVYFLALEYAVNGSLYGHLQKEPFIEHKAASYMFQIVDALAYLQKKNVIHRDLKLENILLSIDDNIKISDFGLSIHSSRRRTSASNL
ncbi:unnamed protein product [Rhizophagus irregularis]|uniref:Protein kinase domain-containing protein n=2 Tax=Rhizophagus irregularis TaxID=588596 RepID=A0A915YYE4_9GLOM|nr:unnamed protein product [Rhizophagus irregularis]CAB5354685.1 unnamed protein product [Rhizophagus irregularis]